MVSYRALFARAAVIKRVDGAKKTAASEYRRDSVKAPTNFLGHLRAIIVQRSGITEAN
jgi:hypothetical protein